MNALNHNEVAATSTYVWTAETFLSHFSDWILSEYSQKAFEFLKAQRDAKRATKTICAGAPDDTALRDLAVAIALIEREKVMFRELETLFVEACETDDELGAFDFTRASTRAWFRRFLANDADDARNWTASGLRCVDLRKASQAATARRLEIAALESQETTGALSEIGARDLVELCAKMK